MVAKAPTNGSDVSRRRKKVRTFLSGLLVQALAGASHAAAARRIGVTEKPVWRWVNGRSPINFEFVLATPRLGRRFRVLLCVHDHDHDLLGYVARKVARKKVASRKPAFRRAA